jgi:hypothetical protein
VRQHATSFITRTCNVPALMAPMTQAWPPTPFDFGALSAVSYGASPMPLVMRACR